MSEPSKKKFKLFWLGDNTTRFMHVSTVLIAVVIHRNDRGFSFERNCVLRRWESETLK